MHRRGYPGERAPATRNPARHPHRQPAGRQLFSTPGTLKPPMPRSSRCGRRRARPNILLVLLDDAGLRLEQRVRRPVPDADLRTAGRRRPALYPVPHDGDVLADPSGAADRPQPPLGGMGPSRTWPRRRRATLAAAEYRGDDRRDATAERLLDRAVRQMPRGADVGDEPDGAVRPLADRQRLRVLLRLHRRRNEPVLPEPYRGHDARCDRTGRRKRATT